MSHSIDKMNIFEAKSAFQKTACFTVIIWKIMYFHTMNKFKENEQFSVVLSIGQQNDYFQGILASDFKGAFPFTMTVSKIIHFKEID